MIEKQGRLAGHLILVTGAARGIGAAVAAAIRQEGGEALATDRQGGDDVQALDVTLGDDWDRVMETLAGRALDGMVHAAGICPVAGIADTDPETWRRTMAVNAEGPFLGIRAAWPHLLASDRASVVIVASMAARVTSPLFPAYSASKAAAVALAKAVALDGARCRPSIRCNTVSPGFVRTDMLSSIGTDLGDTSRHLAASARMTPLGRVADPYEIAAPIIHLLSREASFITGTDLTVDGGVTIQ